MTDIEKREKNLLDMMENFSTWKGVTKINTNDENTYAYRYNDTLVLLNKMNAFIYRVLVYDASSKYNIIDIEAEYHFNINQGTMKMFYDSAREHIKDNSPATILTDLFGYMDKNLWWWINQFPDPKPKPIFMWFEKIKSGELFSDEEMEVDENEDKHN
jgi:hypothetical protein